MDMKQALIDIAYLKSVEAQLAERRAKLQADLIAEMEASGAKSLSADLGNGDAVKGTLVKAERVTIDADRLKKALDAKTWAKVTTQVLDKAKLEAAVAVDLIDANVVAGCSTVADTKPFIRISGGSTQQLVDMTILDPKGNTKPAARRVKPGAKK